MLDRMRHTPIVTLLVILLVSGCTTSQEIQRPNSATQYVIGCWAASGWKSCSDKANELCPHGYSNKSINTGFIRNELTSWCKEAPWMEWHQPGLVE